MKKKIIYWTEDGRARTYISPSISQMKRVKAEARRRGAENISMIISASEPAPLGVLSKVKRLRVCPDQ